MGQDTIIQGTKLGKRYGDFTAVHDIDFTIRHGECFGFLGPNGAGKSSTMRMMYCFSPPSSGSLRVLGEEVTGNIRKIKSKLGVVSQEDSLDPDLSVRQNLLLFSTYFDVPRKEAEKRADELLKFLSLEEKKNQKIDKLSGGMRRRLMIARALINKPEVLILDEPTTGLDPQARHLIWHQLRSLKSSGVTMVLTTHYMEEAHQLCDRIAVMDHGKILAEDTPQALVEKYAGREVLEVRGDIPALKALQEKLRGDTRIPVLDDPDQATELVADTLFLRLTERSVKVFEFYPELQNMNFYLRPASLEDVFLNLTGRDLRD